MFLTYYVGIPVVFFFKSLQDAYNSLSVHGLKMIFGDLNARLHHRLANEHHILSPGCFGDSSASFRVSNNRLLLMETLEVQNSEVRQESFKQ